MASGHPRPAKRTPRNVSSWRECVSPRARDQSASGDPSAEVEADRDSGLAHEHNRALLRLYLAGQRIVRAHLYLYVRIYPVAVYAGQQPGGGATVRVTERLDNIRSFGSEGERAGPGTWHSDLP